MHCIYILQARNKCFACRFASTQVCIIACRFQARNICTACIFIAAMQVPADIHRYVISTLRTDLQAPSNNKCTLQAYLQVRNMHLACNFAGTQVCLACRFTDIYKHAFFPADFQAHKMCFACRFKRTGHPHQAYSQDKNHVGRFLSIAFKAEWQFF